MSSQIENRRYKNMINNAKMISYLDALFYRQLINTKQTLINNNFPNDFKGEIRLAGKKLKR